MVEGGNQKTNYFLNEKIIRKNFFEDHQTLEKNSTTANDEHHNSQRTE